MRRSTPIVQSRPEFSLRSCPSRSCSPRSSRPSPRRQRVRRMLVLGAAAVSFVSSVDLLRAQATNTWTGTVSSTWSAAANWAANTPPATGGSASTILQFNANLANTFTATNDLGNPFQLNGMIFSSTSSSAFTIASAASNALQFTGSNPFIRQSNFGAVTVSSNFSLNPTSGVVTMDGTGTGAATFSGVISSVGSATLTINRPAPTLSTATVALGGANTWTGSLLLNAGNVLFTNAAAAGNAANTIVANGGAIGLSTISIPNPVSISSGADLRYFVGNGTFSGALSGSGGVALLAGAGGSMNFLATNTYNGPTRVGVIETSANQVTAGGTLALRGAAGAIANSSAITVNGGTLIVDDTTNFAVAGGRIGDSAPVTLNSGTIAYTGSSAANSNEVVGILSGTGNNVLTVTAGTSTQGTKFTLSGITRSGTANDRATYFFRGPSLGNAAGTGTAQILSTSAPALVGGGGAAGTKNISIVPWMFGGTSAASTGNSFVTYDATNGFRPLDTTNEYISVIGDGTVTTNNARIGTNAVLTQPTTVNSLILSSGSFSGVGPLTITSGAVAITTSVTATGSLDFGAAEGIIYCQGGAGGTFTGVVSGSNGLTKTGSGSLVFSGANTYSGVTTINQGSFTFGTASAFGNSSAIVISPTIATSTGAGLTTNAAAAITLTQPITINSGIANVSVLSGGTLTLSGPIGGSGGLWKGTGSGTLVLSGNNTYTGPTVVDFGTLVISSDSNLGNGGGVLLRASTTEGINLAGNWTTSRNIDNTISAVVQTNGFNATWNGPVTGSATLVKYGSGKLTLNNAVNPITSTFTINGGTFEVNGTVAPSSSGVTIASGAAVGGTGTIYRTVTVNSGGIVAPGTSVGVLTANAFSLTTATLNWESNGTTTDRLDMFGTLTLSGTSVLNLSGSQLPIGSYTLMNFASVTGTVSNFSLGSTLGGAFDYTLSLTSSKLLLNVASAGNDYAWDADTVTAGVQDGDGNWTPGGPANFFNNVTLANESWTNSFNNNVTFGNTAGGNVTVTAPIQAKKITFNQPYTLSGSGITLTQGITANSDATVASNLTMNGAQSYTVASGKTLTVFGNVGESAAGTALTKAGAGTLLMSGSGSYTGATVVGTGTLALSNGAATGSGAINVGGATLTLADNITVNNPVTADNTASGFSVLTGKTGTITNAISGAGAVNKTGAGTLVLGALPTATGATTIGEGTLSVTVGGNSTMSLGGAGAGVLNKVGAGTLNLIGTSTRTGGSFVSAGTLAVESTTAIAGNGNVTAGPGAAIKVDGALSFSSSAPLGTFTVNGGTLSVPSGGSDAYANSVFVNNGTVDFATTSAFWWHLKPAVGSTSTPAIVVTAPNQTVVFKAGGTSTRFQNDHTAAIDINVADGPNAIDLDSSLLISSGGTTPTFNKAGLGTMRTTNANTANFNINAGQFIMNGTGNSGSMSVASGATLAGTGLTSGAVTVLGGGNVSPGDNLTLAATLTFGASTFSSGSNAIFDLGGTADRISLGTSVLTIPSGAVNIVVNPGFIEGTFTLFTYATSSTVTTSNFALPTIPGYTITPILGTGSFGISIAASVNEYLWDPDGSGVWSNGGGHWSVGGSPVTYANGDDNAHFGKDSVNGVAGTVSTSGAVRVGRIVFDPVGSGVYTIDTSGGALSVSKGITAIVSGNVGAFQMAGNNTMSVASTATLSLTGDISEDVPGRSLNKAGGGTLVLGGNNSYSGGTTLSAGTLSTSATGNLGAGPLTLAGGTLLASSGYSLSQGVVVSGTSSGVSVGPGQTLAVTGALSGSGGFTKVGAGTMSLAGGNTYAGAVTVIEGTLALNNGAVNSFTTLSGTGNVQIGAGANLALTTATQTVSALLSGAGSLSYSPGSVSTLTLGAANTFSGGVVGNANASFALTNFSGFGTGSVQLNTTAAGTGSIAIPSGSGTVANDIVQNGAASLNFVTGTSNQTVTLSGKISGGSATNTIRFTGPADDSSVFVLTNGANDFNFGTISVFEGQLGITSGGALGNAGTIDLDTFTSTSGGLRFDANGISIAKTIKFTSSSGTLGDVVNTQGNTATISGPLVGTGTFTKSGSGKLILTSLANTHTGAININGGTLQVDGILAAGTSVIQVNSGGALGGSSTAARPTNINSGGVVAPGGSVGVLTLRSSATDATTITTLAGGGKYAWEANAVSGTPGVDWDLLQIGQIAVTATGANRFIVQILPSVAFLANFNAGNPGQWKIANYVASNTTNPFDMSKFFVDDSAVPNLGGFYVSSQAAGDGSFDVELNYVPEPSSTVLIGLGAGAYSLLKRRRQA